MSITFFHISITTIIILICALLYSIYLNVKMGLLVLKIEDKVEDCLDTIDERYSSINKILEIPIFFDSVEVRGVIEDIRITRDSLLVVANTLAGIQESGAVDKVEQTGVGEI